VDSPQSRAGLSHFRIPAPPGRVYRIVRNTILLVILLAAALSARGEVAGKPAALRDALAARSMLGDGIWARIVRIDNRGPRPRWRRSSYPQTVYALVFEMSGILWFYTDTDGTQSLSLTLGTLERDKADPGPLLRGIDPGFVSWEWVGEPAGPWVPVPSRPPNACFVESIAALLRRVAFGGEAGSPQLLSYYVDTPGGRLGHTVLIFTTRGGLEAVDAELSEAPVSIPETLGTDPRAVSAFLWGKRVAAARTLPISVPCTAPRPGRWAAMAPQPAPAG
jgi:hypothetical protein